MFLIHSSTVVGTVYFIPPISMVRFMFIVRWSAVFAFIRSTASLYISSALSGDSVGAGPGVSVGLGVALHAAKERMHIIVSASARIFLICFMSVLL